MSSKVSKGHKPSKGFVVPKQKALFVDDIDGKVYPIERRLETWDGKQVVAENYDPKDPLLEIELRNTHVIIQKARPEIETTKTGADRDGVCQAQSTASSGTLMINGALASGGVATMPTSRRVSVYSDNDNNTYDILIKGKDSGNGDVQESIRGPGAGQTEYTRKAFYTVTSVWVGSATNGNIEVGCPDRVQIG